MKKITFLAFALFLFAGVFAQKTSVSELGNNDPVVIVQQDFTKAACTVVGPSNAFENGKNCTQGSGRIVAHDVVVPADQSMTLETIAANMFMGATGSGENAAFVDVYIYADNAGAPGAVIATEAGLVPTAQTVVGNNFNFDLWNVELDIADVMLPGVTAGVESTYWVGLSVSTTAAGAVFWENSTAGLVGAGEGYNDGSGTFAMDATLEGVYTFTGDCVTTCFFANPEDFETADLTEHCWSFYQSEADDPGFIQTDSQFNGGAYSFYHNDDNLAADSDAYMVSPAISLAGAANALTFYYRHNYTPSFYTYSGVWISTTGADPVANPGDWTELVELNDTAPGGYSEDAWTQHTQDLAAYADQDVYIAFKFTGDYDHEFYVDDFEVIDTCPQPTALTATAVTADAATLGWTAGGTETEWNLEWAAAPFTQGSGTAVNGLTANTYDLTGLTANTEYQFYVQGTCNGSWAGPFNFTTLFDGILISDGAVTTCSDNFYDTGGPNGDFQNNEDYTLVVSPDAGANNMVSVTFTAFDCAGSAYDYLKIYDGADDTAPLVIDSNASGDTAMLATFRAHNAAGQLTFVFHSSGVVPNPGWEATFACVDVTGIANAVVEGFEMYPNPVENMLNISTANNIDAISIFNLLGQEVLKATPNATATQIDMSALPTGSYVVKVQAGNQVGSYNLIKQ